GQYQQALADYVEAVGHAPVSALKRPILPASFPESLDSAIDVAQQTHPQVLAAQQALIASDHDARAESTSYLPKLKTELSYLKRDQKDLVGGETVDARALMKMDWNYSVGGAQHARVGRAEHTRAQAKAQLQDVYRRIERDIRVAWSGLDVVREQFKTQENRKDTTAKVVETYKTQYEGDKRTLIEIMQAESQAFDAEVAFANADYGVISATYTLMAAMGQLLPALAPATGELAITAADMPQTETAETPTEAVAETPQAEAEQPAPADAASEPTEAATDDK
ncbi:MAG: TolC family protein, partial [Alphaproteobacteria bacterium]|nr:TolC family protein [Alphaproteobacteria bacterium]